MLNPSHEIQRKFVIYRKDYGYEKMKLEAWSACLNNAVNDWFKISGNRSRYSIVDYDKTNKKHVKWLKSYWDEVESQSVRVIDFSDFEDIFRNALFKE